MSTARDELRDLIAARISTQLVFDEGHSVTFADSIMEALTANEVTEGWLITGKRILKVEETSLTDPGDENWAYDVYCTPPGEDDDSDDEETED